jgi:hypothetical protein
VELPKGRLGPKRYFGQFLFMLLEAKIWLFEKFKNKVRYQADIWLIVD